MEGVGRRWIVFMGRVRCIVVINLYARFVLFDKRHSSTALQEPIVSPLVDALNWTNRLASQVDMIRLTEVIDEYTGYIVA